MDWYRNALFWIALRYRSFNGERSLPDAWAVVTMSMLHVSNAASAIDFYWKGAHEDSNWLFSAGQRVISCGAVASIPYCLYFVRSLRRAMAGAEDVWDLRCPR